MARKVEVQLQLLPDAQTTLASLRVGQTVDIQTSTSNDGELTVVTRDGTAVGTLPASTGPSLRNFSDPEVTVRSIKRDTDAQVVSQVLIRITARSAQSQQAGQSDKASAEDQEEDETLILRHAQLEQLAADEAFKITLKDERLQSVLTDIDKAPDREQAIALALQQQDFRDVADKMLGLIKLQVQDNTTLKL